MLKDNRRYTQSIRDTHFQKSLRIIIRSVGVQFGEIIGLLVFSHVIKMQVETNMADPVACSHL